MQYSNNHFFTIGTKAPGIILAVLLIVSVSNSYAVQARRGWRTMTQPDGTTIELQQVGDEHFHYFTNRQGQKVRQNDAGYWVVITNAEFDQHRKAKHTSVNMVVPRTMHVGDTFTPTVHTNSSGSISFYTSDDGIVAVDPILGTITALNEGRVQIVVEVAPTRYHYSATRTLIIRVVP